MEVCKPMLVFYFGPNLAFCLGLRLQPSQTIFACVDGEEQCKGKRLVTSLIFLVFKKTFAMRTRGISFYELRFKTAEGNGLVRTPWGIFKTCTSRYT